MDTSLSNFELNENEIKIGTNSENGSEYTDIEANLVSLRDTDFDNNLPHTVTLLTHQKTGAKVYLIGTAHFSKESQEDVRKVIRNVQPQMIVVELCRSRTSVLELDENTILEEAKDIGMAKVMALVKRNGVINGLMYVLMLNMSAFITKQIGMAPGGEFRVAFREASNIPNCCIHLGDRPIDITLRRAISRLTWFQTIKLAWHLITAKDPISVEEMESCKNSDILEKLFAELGADYPMLREALLDERDIYLTSSLQLAASIKPNINPSDGPIEPLKVVGVVGIGHVAGITRLWPEDQIHRVTDIMTIPPQSMTSKIMRFTFKVSLIGLGGYLVYRLVPTNVKTHSSIFMEKVICGLKDHTCLKSVMP
ncbi:traB domain-containing protein [Rhynchophorus ferrugineus]|uniref:TraB domain-containing protein n=1 Tax=Rhynchophorus ferrugineus TaxID=354439 RepID=A0A834IL82_RHYFE|nr:hypothetical protein GWI33_006758 [Rhynchophorus ferrugineus]